MCVPAPSPAEATSEIISGEYGGQDNRLVYAVFTTPKNSISASAICAFRLRDLLDTFEGAFKEQGRTDGMSRTLSSFLVPKQVVRFMGTS